MSIYGKIGEGYTYLFPPLSKKIDIKQQCDKIIEEANEYKEEVVNNPDPFASVVEGLDIIHAVETSFRTRLESGEITPELVLRAKMYVLKKNDRRGYYDKQISNLIAFADVLLRGGKYEQFMR